MTKVAFRVKVTCRTDAERMWQKLIDWRGHSEWVPVTSVKVLHGDGGVGTEFVARTGVSPIAFDDWMQVTKVEAETRTAEVKKLGSLLTGGAGFTVHAANNGCVVEWWEDVRVKHLPGFLAPAAAMVFRRAFQQTIAGLDRRLSR